MQVLVRYLKRFAFARGAEEAQAFEIIAPIEVVGAVAVIVQLDGVVLPEPQPGASVVKLRKLKPECAIFPWIVTGDAAPDQLAALIEGDDFHHRVEVSGEGPVLLRAHLSFRRAQSGAPPACQAVRYGERGPDSRCGYVDIDDVMDKLHRFLSSFFPIRLTKSVTSIMRMSIQSLADKR